MSASIAIAASPRTPNESVRDRALSDSYGRLADEEGLPEEENIQGCLVRVNVREELVNDYTEHIQLRRGNGRI